jgi:hypothetical protein
VAFWDFQDAAAAQIMANLGRLFLAAQQLEAVPAFFSGVMHNIFGSLLASRRKSRPSAKDNPRAR